MSFADLFRLATKHEPYPYQERLASGALPEIVEVPTGFGKTDALLMPWLESHCRGSMGAGPRRLVYCLPMRVLVEQTAERARELVGRLSAAGRLLQPISVATLLGGSLDTEWDAQPDKPAILVGTQDQLLSRALMRGYGTSRYRWPIHFAWLHNDCRWVFDEVQLMGPGLSTATQLHAFRERLGTCGACESVWMSATLDEGRLDTVDVRGRDWRRFGLTDEEKRHPRLAQLLGASKPLERVAGDPAEPGQLAEVILGLHVASSRTLVVINRVDRARELFRALREHRGDVETRLLHSRFRPAERRPLQAEVLADDWAGVLVSTQAIEAGVDVSARTLVTELAPWSSLVQRFGRCNRRAEHGPGEARVAWIDLPDEDDWALPYEREELRDARRRLLERTDVGPANLSAEAGSRSRPELPVLRRRDLIELFDTEPDLAGHDIDVSPYIRATTESDVQVAWRAFPPDGPGASEPEPERDELCSVPLHGLRKLLGKSGRAFLWDGLDGAWTSHGVGSLVPGSRVLLQASAGGYDAELGWTGLARPPVDPVPVTGEAPEAEESDRLTFGCREFVTLALHSNDVAEEMVALRDALEALTLPWAELVEAARWHDLGKAHPAFQTMLTDGLPPEDPRRAGGPWAKSDGTGGRNPRRYFRHELASALALLQAGRGDLAAYLAAAHHGKVRMRARPRPGERGAGDGRDFALGVWEDDALPAVELGDGHALGETKLSLDALRLGTGIQGASWVERAAGLLDAYGPFRLAYMESLVRIADWRGTARRRVEAELAHA